MIMNVYSLGITSMCIELSDIIEMLYSLIIDMQDEIYLPPLCI